MCLKIRCYAPNCMHVRHNFRSYHFWFNYFRNRICQRLVRMSAVFLSILVCLWIHLLWYNRYRCTHLPHSHRLHLYFIFMFGFRHFRCIIIHHVNSCQRFCALKNSLTSNICMYVHFLNSISIFKSLWAQCKFKTQTKKISQHHCVLW